MLIQIALWIAVAITPAGAAPLPAGQPKVCHIDARGGLRLRTLCGLHPSEQKLLERAVALVQAANWEGADRLLDGLPITAAPSLDLELLRALVKEQRRLVERIGRGDLAPCDDQVTSGGTKDPWPPKPSPVEAWVDPEMTKPAGTLTFPGTWSSSPESGDAGWDLDRIRVVAQTPVALKIERKGEPPVWVRNESVYVRRLVVEKEGRPVHVAACFPDAPFHVEKIGDERIRVTFIPDHWRALLGIGERYPEPYGSSSARRSISDALDGPGHEIRTALLSPALASIRWGVTATYRTRDFRLTIEPRRNGVETASVLGFRDTNDSEPACGAFPQGPSMMKLCRREISPRSPDRKWSLYVTGPDDNIY